MLGPGRGLSFSRVLAALQLCETVQAAKLLTAPTSTGVSVQQDANARD